MSRKRTEPVSRAEEEFRRELRIRQGYYDLMSQRALSASCGIPQATLSKRLSRPEDLTVAELRKLVGTLGPDPYVMLILLGYSQKDVTRMAEGLNKQKAG